MKQKMLVLKNSVKERICKGENISIMQNDVSEKK